MSDTQQHKIASFVRKDMLPPSNAPAGNVGFVRWVRENLFSGPFNTILTVVLLFCIWYVVSGFLGWALRSAWYAESLTECREIIAARYGEGTHGACWAVIRDRFLQLLYGFYPSELYWRINLSFVLLLVALAPILFTAIPRKMLWFSAIYPFLGYWLLWGGSIWGPVMVVAGFALGGLAFKYVGDAFGALLGTIAAAAVPIIWWLLLAGPVAGAIDGLIPIGITEVESSKFGGFSLSVIIGVSGIVCSLPLGILLALGRQSNLFIVRSICIGYIEFIRGVPLITLLFVASTLLNYFMPPGTNFDIILRVVIMVTLFASAYMAEVIRGGLAALPKGQYEGADSLGLNYWQAQRLIVMPQALKISIPNIVSTFIGLFKDTVLVSIIGLLDPLGLSNAIRADAAWNGIVWELYAFIAFMFFIFCFSMSRYSIYLENKLKTDHR
ncbi:amino acid ABC transporter permease [Algicella marina]|uniref:ABC transporter permease subunit n=1 Tax=Algicella marina TaxID=2683284 RepID=A0A6P1T014_9RHOB|nr:amino acid ABC transporter permease [Algicella marina]QHQ33832.1 ABC transporter permease subunit [Algicella marina]